jgi:hypothetical protein
VRSTIDRNGGLAGLRSQLRRAKALSWLIEHVAIVDDEGHPLERAVFAVDRADADVVQDGPDQAPPPVEEAEQ